MRHFTLAVTFLALVLALGRPLQGQEPPPSAAPVPGPKAVLDQPLEEPATGTPAAAGITLEPGDIKPEVYADMPENPKVGEDVDYHIRVVVPTGVKLLVPERFNFPDSVKLMRERITLKRTPVEGDKVQFDLKVPLRVLGLGWVRIPGQTLTFELPSSQQVVVQATKLRFHTGTHFPTENDPQPSPPLAPLPLVETNWVLIWALAIIGLILVTMVATLLLVRWRRSRIKPLPPPPRPAHEVAFERLSRLSAQDFLEKGELALYYTALSEALREYLGGRWRFDSMDLTTTELISRIKRLHMQGVVLEEVVTMLQDFDLVKFAKVEPAGEDAKAALRQVWSFVERTREQENAPAPEAGEEVKS